MEQGCLAAARRADNGQMLAGHLPSSQIIPDKAAALTQLEEHQIRHAIGTGKLPVLDTGKQIRIRRCDLFRLKGTEK